MLALRGAHPCGRASSPRDLVAKALLKRWRSAPEMGCDHEAPLQAGRSTGGGSWVSSRPHTVQQWLQLPVVSHPNALTGTTV